MTSQELRKKFLDFFVQKGHKMISSAPLVPENDPTVLFTTAGMHPLVPYLLGQPHALGQRLCSSQKCIRTGDIDDVGDNTHLTFFEMLGNWSLGDYFKREAIEWSFDFLTKELGIPLERLAFSVFKGEPENNISCDEEAADIWQKLGVLVKRIAYLGREDNWWGPAGQTGPCGPDTEMFYWTGEDPAPQKFNPFDKHWVEVWNNVFMEYNKKIKNQKSKIKKTNKDSKIKIDYEFIPLKQKNVDTGMGLERTLAVLNGKSNVYETDLFTPIINEIKNQISKIKNINQNSKIDEIKAQRIIADHIKAATFILSEGVAPANTERGYVARRLIRRAIRYGKILGIEQEFMPKIAQAVIQIYQDVYSEVKNNQQFIFNELEKEEIKFRKTLERGLKELDKLDKVDAEKAFFIYQTYGFPLEMIQEELAKKALAVDAVGFQAQVKKHQELSRSASAGKFKSGLTDHSQATVKLHTAAHLLHQALRQVLGDKVHQAGSNITSERLRFDFSYSQKLTDAEMAQIEKIVNEQIQMDLPVKCETMPYQQAIDSAALAFFKDRYPEKVNVYSIGKFSREVCAGPHIKHLDELGKFKILKQESVGASLRRIKAILE
ncbi:MAG: alanine--tRNA ligase [Candidatus Portnoybacteria bacterium CG_4_10_14_0_2_um_filter_39_11]|uniref:Alanine--tRNA ligase n=1 Tax=Candidatus Portnoybacteria bacterium CG_4_10_14_0_2_um_filter_39_11 TaxID=1974797 RepID=A0A2M7UHV7_9BACT|nr:MAG: alanine--tRNA ligase [Candidatus Portnoybacteria bacterium CG_4_10_14_0_2_um_filter_39_11]